LETSLKTFVNQNQAATTQQLKNMQGTHFAGHSGNTGNWREIGEVVDQVHLHDQGCLADVCRPCVA
jgi:hypothetical protein